MPPIPAPPDTINAPVFVALDSVVNVNKLAPEMGYPTNEGYTLYNSLNKTVKSDYSNLAKLAGFGGGGRHKTRNYRKSKKSSKYHRKTRSIR